MKTHRGLSAVVGTVFLIAVVIGALSYISYSIDVMGNFSEQIIAEESRQRDIQDEKFELVTVDTVTNKLDATIKNTGEIPVKITKMYLDEIGDNTDVVQKIDIDQTIAPGNSFDFFSESIDVDIDSAKGYSMKLVTSRGETQTFYLNSASQEPLDIRLIASPNRIPTGFSTTIMMVVVNNMSNNNPLVNLTPIEPACSGICAKLTGPVPASYDVLKPGDIAIFRWVYELEGDSDESVTFESGILNGLPGNTASKTVTITAIQSSEVAGQSLVSLGFGQAELSSNSFVLHLETYGVPEPPAPPPGGMPNPIHNYELNGDATDEMGGTNLQLSGTGGTLTATGWDFTAANKAQIVSGEIPDTTYAIEMVFSFDDYDAWIRLLDFHNHLGGFGYKNNEYGLYVVSKKFDFYNGIGAGTAGSFGVDGTLTHVLIQRDAATGLFEVYQDGSKVMSFSDFSGQIGKQEATFRGTPTENTSGQPATFFKDNGSEDSPGFVDCIRVFDEAFSSANAITITTNTDTCYQFAQIGAIYQMNPVTPDAAGTTFIFDDTSDVSQWFSANVTSGNTIISAGNWNASLRYNHDPLPSGMASGADVLWQNGNNGGIKLHFEDVSESTGLYDSGQDPTCYVLSTSGSADVVGATHSATMGVNGSGAYFFDGTADYLIVDGLVHGSCANPHYGYSIAAWFKSTAAAGWVDKQTIIYTWDTVGALDEGGYKIWLSDGTDPLQRGSIYYDHRAFDGSTVRCESYGDNAVGSIDYADGNWHHVAVTMTSSGCTMYVDGVFADIDAGSNEENDGDDDIYIGANESGAEEFFGYIDDVMVWGGENGYELTSGDVTALKAASFGADATKLNFYLNNATGAGTTLDVLAADTNYGMNWSDPGHYTDVDDLWKGGNWTIALPQVGLKTADPFNRLNFTISYASGAAMNLRIDDINIDGVNTNALSSYLQSPPTDPESPFYRIHDNDDKVTFYTYNGEDEGVWFTYQGTRIIFNGTGGHYTGVVDSVNTGFISSTLDVDHDSPFIDSDVGADVVFWHPQNIPTASPPSTPEKIPPGVYGVTVYLNGYDEDGSVLIRSISLGTVQVVD